MKKEDGLVPNVEALFVCIKAIVIVAGKQKPLEISRGFSY
jgi:hypothetical protein